MNTQFCKVGKIKFGLSDIFNIQEIERNCIKFAEEAYSLLQTNSHLSDLLYHEASTLQKILLHLKMSRQMLMQHFEVVKRF